MPKIFITRKVDDAAAVDNGTWDDIQAEAAKHRRSRVTVESYSEEAEWSEQQRKWWKGVLLPALAKDSGNSISYWEKKLKKNVMPDDFPTTTEIIDGEEISSISSVNTLSMKKMNILIEGSVEQCHEWGFNWVTLPDKDKRKNKISSRQAGTD